MTQAQAIAIRQARHARVRMIRRRVIAGVVALFIATWLLITVMLVTGHDPALARQSAKATTASSLSGSSSSSSGSVGATSTSTGGQSSGVSSVSSGGQSSGGVSSVSSSQS
jgi:uncharacterized membrane protein YgcG